MAIRLVGTIPLASIFLAASAVSLKQETPEALIDLGTGLEAVRQEESSKTVVFEGFVLDPDGAPAEGAIVASSAGGRVVVDHLGFYRLQVEVPNDAERVEVKAVGQGGRSLEVSRLVALPSVSGATKQVGPLWLARAPCSPRWLPTFGGVGVTSSVVHALTVHDDGEGPALFAGGGFEYAGGRRVNGIAKRVGRDWSSLGGGVHHDVGTPRVYALATFDDGSGPALFAGGFFTRAGDVPASHIAKWDGSRWSALGGGLDGTVLALTMHDDGDGPALYAGGRFSSTGRRAANRVARWDGTSWTSLGKGMDDDVRALISYDDGAGPALYAGGSFLSAGDAPVRHIAKWDGSTWSNLEAPPKAPKKAWIDRNAIGPGMNGDVHALAVYDDGGGPELYVGGRFEDPRGFVAPGVARWNGLRWASLGDAHINGSVKAMTVYDDGGGPALFVGGAFSTAGAQRVDHIARWDGSSWSSLGDGLEPTVLALAGLDEDGTPALFAGGFFTRFAPGEGIAKWNGSTWMPVGSSPSDRVNALAVHDDGNGPALYVGGNFRFVNEEEMTGIAKWDGSSWTSLDTGLPAVDSLAVYDDGGGSALYAGGRFTAAGGLTVNGIAKWDGSAWASLGSGINGGETILAMTVYDDGGGPALYVGGDFYSAGGVAASRIARWDGSSWSSLGSGIGGFRARVLALAVYDDGLGPALFAGGAFTMVGGVPAYNVAKWDGATWSAVGSGLVGDFVGALAVYDDGAGPELYAGGDFYRAGIFSVDNISRWNGTRWGRLGRGIRGSVRNLAVREEAGNSTLYVGGDFSTAGQVVARGIARKNPGWSALGGGMKANGTVRALAVLDDECGPVLYAGGDFIRNNDSGDRYLARWGCACPLLDRPEDSRTTR